MGRLKKRRPVRLFITIFVLLPLALAIAGGAYFVFTYHSLNLNRQLEEPSLLYDREGKEIGRFSSEIREVISLDQMSPYIIDAVIAIEDSRFYQHHGIDPRGIARALFQNLRKGKVVEGGSTITQQLAENEYFFGVTGPARTLDKKIREAIYAIKLERTFTKEEILERYLNRIYFGHGRFGVEAAAQYYFGKSAAELDLSESALLVGIPNGPALYSLRDNPENAHKRRDIILARMEELGYITAQEREEAQARVLEAVVHQERVARASQFRQRVESEVRSILKQRFPGMNEQEISNLIYNQGLRIDTTLSLSIQAAAEQVMQQRGEALREKNPNIQGVIIALDANTGGILALVESIELTGTTRRADWVYDLGSSFKGILYTAALENGYTASSTLLCEETAFPNPGGKPNPYVPSDFDKTWHNRALRIREALEVSCNVAAVRIGQEMGLEKFLSLVARLNPRLAEKNIGKANELQLPLGPDASPMNLTLTHAPLVNGGYSVSPYYVQQIRDRDGNILYQAWPQRKPVLDERLGYIVTKMLQGVQGIRNMTFDVAGKTGTSDNLNTVFVGYTSEMVATVFFGFDKPSQASDVGNAVTVAAPAWRDFINRVYADGPPPPFSRPAGVEEAVVCTVSGQLATYLCPETYVEYYMPGTAPRTRCEAHTGDTVEICSSTGLPANTHCPQHLRRPVPREPWMNNLQCWLHGPSPFAPPGQEPGVDDEGDEEGEEDRGENSQDENSQGGREDNNRD